MNAVQIEKILRRKCGEIFLGVFAADEIPRNFRKPAILVANNESKEYSGEHWIAIYFGDDGKGEFFDSFGRIPRPYFASYMYKHSSVWIYNDIQLQNYLSSFCGHYCVLYCCYRSVGLNMTSIVNMFGRNTIVNDYLVHKFVCSQ